MCLRRLPVKIEVQPSTDIAFFNRMVNHPTISAHVRDDSIVGAIDCSPLAEGDHHLLQILGDGQEAGFIILLSGGNGEYEMHSGFLPEFRGKTVIEAGKAAIRWAEQRPEVKRLTTWAWGHARHVQFIARKVGFTEISRSPWHNTVNGAPATRVNFEKYPSPCL